MQRSRLLPGLLAVAVVSMGMSGDCESSCIPTTTTATVADKVDLTAVGQSSTLTAKLTVTETGEALSGKTLKFSVYDDGEQVYREEGSTVSGGVLTIDLKKLDIPSLRGIARGDQWQAAFEGDSTYCSSSDDKDFRVLKAPAGVTVRSP